MRFITFARLQTHAYVALDQGYLQEVDFKTVYDGLDHIARLLSNLITHVA